jgi:hypothetical protein
MTHHDLVHQFVLAEISDDYEEPEHITENVLERARICGMLLEPQDVCKTLIDLTESGLAKAYSLSVHPPAEVRGAPPMDQLQDYYFLITPKGEKILLSKRDQWPLDEEDCLRPGWSPPAE